MKTAQENISTLPAKCFGILPIDNSIIIIKAGEMGYYPTAQPPIQLTFPKTIEDFVNEINLEDGITIQQRKAMEHGSLFGWGCARQIPIVGTKTENIRNKNTLF